MNSTARRPVVAALIELARSPDVQDRADAGRSLAIFAADPGARQTLLELVLDTENTFVTRVTAVALLRRHDAAGLEVVASALAAADTNHADWIYTAVLDVLTVFGRERDAAVRVCEVLTQDPDGRVRDGARRLIATLTEINPVLLPVQDA